MRKEEKNALPADFAPWHVLPKLSPWKRPSASLVRNTYKEEKYAAKYEINMLRCIFCGLCEEACPKDAIYLSQTFAPANYGRKGFIYSKDDLLIPDPTKDPEGYAKAKGDIGKNIK
jgi:NADH-quinone oxidoreductase subunit I